MDIYALIAHTIKEVLEDWCINYVAEDDSSRAQHVLLGKPTGELRSEIVLSVHMNHPLGPEAGRDKSVAGRPMAEDERPYKWPMEWTGGMNTEAILGAVQINYRRRKSYDAALEDVGPIIARIKSGINRDSRLNFLVGDCGGHMSIIETIRGEGYTSGGGDVSLERVWVTFRAWVHTSNRRINIKAQGD